MNMLSSHKVIIKGGGDLASAVAQKDEFYAVLAKNLQDLKFTE